MIYSIKRIGLIHIGRQGEHLAQTIQFDVSTFLKRWPDAEFSILVRRPGEENPYIGQTSLEGDILSWIITSTETAVAGDGRIEVRAAYGDMVAKSDLIPFRVSSSMTGHAHDPPDPFEDWVSRVTDAAQEVEQAVDRLTGLDAQAVTLAPGEKAYVELRDGVLIFGIPQGYSGSGESGSTVLATDETLRMKNGVLGVVTASSVEKDNTLPITSAAVFTEVGNINSLLYTI